MLAGFDPRRVRSWLGSRFWAATRPRSVGTLTPRPRALRERRHGIDAGRCPARNASSDDGSVAVATQPVRPRRRDASGHELRRSQRAFTDSPGSPLLIRRHDRGRSETSRRLPPPSHPASTNPPLKQAAGPHPYPARRIDFPAPVASLRAVQRTKQSAAHQTRCSAPDKAQRTKQSAAHHAKCCAPSRALLTKRNGCRRSSPRPSCGRSPSS